MEIPLRAYLEYFSLLVVLTDKSIRAEKYVLHRTQTHHHKAIVDFELCWYAIVIPLQEVGMHKDNQIHHDLEIERHGDEESTCEREDLFHINGRFLYILGLTVLIFKKFNDNLDEFMLRHGLRKLYLKENDYRNC